MIYFSLFFASFPVKLTLNNIEMSLKVLFNFRFFLFCLKLFLTCFYSSCFVFCTKTKLAAAIVFLFTIMLTMTIVLNCARFPFRRRSWSRRSRWSLIKLKVTWILIRAVNKYFDSLGHLSNIDLFSKTHKLIQRQQIPFNFPTRFYVHRTHAVMQMLWCGFHVCKLIYLPLHVKCFPFGIRCQATSKIDLDLCCENTDVNHATTDVS